MTTAALEKSVKKLSREVKALRSFIIESAINEDDEGEYKPAFIKEIKKALKEKPIFEYKGRGSLLKQIRGL